MSLCGVSSHLSAKTESWKLKVFSFSIFNFPFSIASLRLAWWRWWDSNPWPPACRAGALPAELHPHIQCTMHNAQCIIMRYSLFFTVFSGFGNGFTRSLTCVSIELSSRAASRQVFSPLQSLTSVFGMGTGGPSAFVALTFFSVTLRHWILNNNHSLFLGYLRHLV